MSNTKNYMLKKILFFILLLQFSCSFCQNPTWDFSKICSQLDQAAKYILEDKEEHINYVRFHDSINDGRNYFLLEKEYVAYKLGVEPKNIDYTSSKTNVFFKKLNSATYDTFKLNLNCIDKKKRKRNTYLSKVDNETIVLHIVDKKDKYKGVTYLFCFDKENLVKIYKTHWIS